MERTLRITNLLLGVIAVCLVVLVARSFGLAIETKAYAANNQPQPVYLKYFDQKDGKWKAVVGSSGVVPTSR